ncbi:FAD dependent oxidoreductase [delta proteobacterium NaphS2]|nr:FAD dependent oxidoreductase [delta proteobacterium NaphS2]
MENAYDVIIIGAGPNGLEAGAYLARAGSKVLVLEKRYEGGGGLATEEVTFPGFLHNTHAVYMMMVDFAPIYQDFKLEAEYNCKHIHPELQFALPLSDGRCVCLYTDVEKTCANFAQFSKKDAESYREFCKLAEQCMDEFIGPATYAPPSPLLEAVVKMQSNDVGRTVMEYSEMTALDIVHRHFENEHIRALMLYVACHWGVDYNQSGLGYLVLLYLNRAINYRLVRGGSHMVAQSLIKIIHEHKGVTINNVRIKRILMENGAARGVELTDGTIYRGKAIISTADPHQTFFNLVGKEHLSDELTEMLESYQWEKHSLLGIHLAMEHPPRFTAADSNPDIEKAFVHILGMETEEEVIKEFDAVYNGELQSEAHYNCCFPSVLDPSQLIAPVSPGRCTGLLSRLAPYDLAEGGSDRWYNFKFKQELVKAGLATLQKYAPNIDEDNILWHYVSTPVDVENKFPSMVKGGIKHGAYAPLQMGYNRPNHECSTTKTPVENLYLGGASCYPGGLVIWGAGYNAANRVAEDLGIDKWWQEPPGVTKARESGLI